MNCKIFIVLSVVAVLGQSAVIPRVKPVSHRQPRTLGLLTAGASALSGGIGAVGSAAATAVGVAAAAKPLILLGLGKYALWNYLRNQNSGYAYASSYGGDDGYYYVDETPASATTYYGEYIPVDQLPEQPIVVANGGW